MTPIPSLAIIGGSGLYSIPGLEDMQSRQVDTPFGEPSSPLITGRLAGQPVVFLARHGIGHTIPPSQVNYRANIYALKALGVRFVLAVSACGSLREDYAPGNIVIPDQLFDFTRQRPRSFFDQAGFVAHVSVAEPFCNAFGRQVQAAGQAAGGTVHAGGSYITIEGPRFSTRAESDSYRAWGHSIIGMTTSPEAFLAREAELCYAVMAHVTDYDVWHKEPVSVEMVTRTMHHNLSLAQESIRQLATALDAGQQCACGSALQGAIATQHDKISAGQRQQLGLLLDKYLDS